MSITIIVTMCVINLILWAVFFIKFKSLFSTEDVLRKTREQVGQLISEVNGITLSNINLIDSKIEELHDAIENAERRIATADAEEKRSSKIPLKETKKKSAGVSNAARRVVEDDDAFEVKVNSKTSSKKTKKAEPVKTKKDDGPEIYMTKNPITQKRSFQKQVAELYNLGYTIEQIAKETERSTTEVEFVIDML